MMYETLIKTQPDWHEPLNRNAITAEDKGQIIADFVYDSENNRYTVTPRNIPVAVVTNLPHTLPEIFTIAGRMPDDYKEDAAFRVGAVDFAAKYAEYEAGDIVSINFDRLEQTCFFKRGGGGGSFSLAAFAGYAYAGHSYVG